MASWFPPGLVPPEEALPNERAAIERLLRARMGLAVPPTAGKATYYRALFLTQLWRDARGAPATRGARQSGRLLHPIYGAPTRPASAKRHGPQAARCARGAAAARTARPRSRSTRGSRARSRGTARERRTRHRPPSPPRSTRRARGRTARGRCRDSSPVRASQPASPRAGPKARCQPPRRLLCPRPADGPGRAEALLSDAHLPRTWRAAAGSEWGRLRASARLLAYDGHADLWSDTPPGRGTGGRTGPGRRAPSHRELRAT